MFPTEATFDTLIDEVIHNLGGFTQVNDAMTTTQVSIGTTDTTITVADASSFSRGVAEVGTELIYLTDVDQGEKRLYVAPWGRGFRGTIAASWPDGTRITMSPAWPRASVGREINNVITGLYPYLYGVKTVTVQMEPNNYAYELPADCVRVLDVKWRVPGVRRDWVRVRHWDYDLSAPSADFPSGRSVEIYSDDVRNGSEVQITYAVRPTPLSDLADPFSDTGLDPAVKDVVVLGTVAKLAPYMDVSRLPMQAVEADEMDVPRQVGSAVGVAREFQRSFQQRLTEEQKALQDRYPIRYRRVR